MYIMTPTGFLIEKISKEIRKHSYFLFTNISLNKIFLKDYHFLIMICLTIEF